MYKSIIVDGVKYNVVSAVQRTAEITPSDVSGLMYNKNYYNDVIATYLKYTITIVVPKDKEGDYSDLYDVLISPNNNAVHSFILPFNQKLIQLNARVETISDDYVGQEGRNGSIVKLWRNTKVEVIGIEPYTGSEFSEEEEE